MRKILLMLLLALSSLLTQAQTSVIPAGKGTADDPYQIATLENLYWLSKDTTAWNKYIIQTADIDASDTRNWADSTGAITGFPPIGFFPAKTSKHFKAIYNGKGHTISNLYIKQTNGGIGLFSCTFANSSIDSLHVENAYVYGTSYVGIIVGYLDGGKITNCTSSGSVVGISSSYFSPSIYVGGLVGEAESIYPMTNCSSSANVTGYDCVGGLVGRSQTNIESCFSTGNVSGYVRVGGFTGSESDYAKIKNSYCTGNVKGENNIGGFIGTVITGKDSAIINCYCTGTVDGTNAVGGFIGKAERSILNCHSTGNVTGIRSVGGFAGENNSLLKYCYSTGNVTAAPSTSTKYAGGFCGYSYNTGGKIEQSYCTGNVSGYTYVGGFIGNLLTPLYNCYSTGNVTSIYQNKIYIGGFSGSTSSYAVNCYSIGNVTYPQTATYKGAFGGHNSSTITNCYWNTQTTSQTIAIENDSSNSTITGLSIEQMKQRTNFNAWNFDTIWGILNDSTYPFLQKIKNAPIASPDSLTDHSAINLDDLLLNDFYQDSTSTNLIYSIVNCTSHYGSISGKTFTFGVSNDSTSPTRTLNQGATDTLSYRVGCLIAPGDTLWGNQTTCLLTYKSGTGTDICNTQTSEPLSISPNPAANAFVIKKLQGTANVSISQMDGKLVKTQTLTGNAEVNVSGLPSGIYIVKIVTPSQTIKQKLVKK